MEEGDEVVGGMAAGGVSVFASLPGGLCPKHPGGMDLQPLSLWSYQAIRKGRDDILAQVIMNVLAFIPIGLLLGTFKGMKWWQALLIGLCFPFFFKFLQLVLKRGLAEIDDVVHNGVGCVIGYWAFVGLRKMTASCFGGGCCGIEKQHKRIIK